MKQLWTVKETAERLNVKPLTIYRWVTAGKLPAVRLGRALRFDPKTLEAFFETVRVGPGGLKD